MLVACSPYNSATVVCKLELMTWLIKSSTDCALTVSVANTIKPNSNKDFFINKTALKSIVKDSEM